MPRPDANHLSLRIIKSILEAARPLQVEIAGKTVTVAVELLPAMEWPRDRMVGLSEEEDGPWPASRRLSCTWDGGSVQMDLAADFWRINKGAKKHHTAIKIGLVTHRRELVWVTVPSQVGVSADGATISLSATVVLVKRKGDPETWALRERAAQAVIDYVNASGLPMLSATRVELAKITLPQLDFDPSAEAAFRRLVRLALLKLDFIDPDPERHRGTPLIEAATPLLEEASGEEQDEPSTPRRYWAGGHQFGEHSMLDEFRSGNHWRLGWPKDSAAHAAQVAWRRFGMITAGDWFAIKGYGGNHDLVVHYIGRVVGVDEAEGRLELGPLDLPLYQGKAPQGPGAGSWFDALLEVSRPDVIQTIFGESTQGEEQELGTSSSQSRPPLPLNCILYGPPGTGKTYAIRNEYRKHFIRAREQQSLGNFGTGASTRMLQAIAAEDLDRPERFSFVTFHQSYAYEDFIEGIRPALDQSVEARGGLRYLLSDGIFKTAVRRAILLTGFLGTIDEFCRLPAEERARHLEGAPRYAIFIDEINRGNVANIFGELITLLEDDKRLGGHNEIIVTLPYSQTRFGVPSNLHLIGTMNTADRSIEALDTALRRRFSFVECMPRPELLDFEIEGGIDTARMLTAINDRLERIYDRDHLIGHAYLKSLEDDPSLEALKEVFERKIVPLLQEYFYGDWGRIGLVLGREIVRIVGPSAAPFADFDHEDAEALAERPRYALADMRTLTSTSFRRIYERVSDDD